MKTKQKQNDSSAIHAKYYRISSWSLIVAITWEAVAFIWCIIALFNNPDHSKVLFTWVLLALLGTIIPGSIAGWADTKNMILRSNMNDSKAVAKSAKNREKYRLFTALHELATLRGVTWLTPKPVVVHFEGGVVKYFPSHSSVPGQNTGKTIIITANGQGAEVTKENIGCLSSSKVLDAVESSLAEAKVDQAVTAEEQRDILKNL